MKTIWKFPLAVEGFQKIDMPKGAVILTVQTQADRACLWAKVDTRADKEPRGFWIHGTGHEIEHEEHHGRYIGTFQVHDGALIFHVFEHEFQP